jgi:DNA repair exonuclease SbcCD nuclease subunit
VWFLAACGNHDPGGAGFRTAELGLAGERVRFFRDGAPAAVTVADARGAPVGVVVGAGHVSDREPANLAAAFPRLAGALPVVGLLHTSLASAKTAEAHDRFAPSTRADYERLDYAYWALGHIHLRQQALEGLPVHYAGNLQGRNPRETGAKGGLVVEAFPRASAEPRFVRFAPLRWERIVEAALPASRSTGELAAQLVRRIEAQSCDPGERLALRIELAGETPLAHTLRSREALAELEDELMRRSGALEVQLRAEGVSPPLDRARLRQSPSVLATALELIERARLDPALLDELAPAELAVELEDTAARREHLRGLLPGLSEELLLRGVEREGA